MTMSDVIIKAEDLGKKYMIGHQAENDGYLSMRDVLTQGALTFLHKTADLVQGKPIVQGDTLEEVWALKDVNFEIRRGEVVGIIGRNGAGKSTLLKILSRITEPSTGRVTIKGRVASLLEVGTGFHPELTGRENIYLNGAILGMTRSEIKRKFDEIVAFAEVERFLDTPVKRYSSGMYVRLAFAVAAHLEPEILLVDEVLAVGDAEFQKKCLGKMGDVAKEGRTVLFVSHNMAAILSLCEHGYLLDGGHMVCNAAIDTVVAEYMKSSSTINVIPLVQRMDRKGDGSARLTAIQIDNGVRGTAIRCGDCLRIALTYRAERELSGVTVLISVYDEFNRPIFFFDSDMTGGISGALPESGTIVCTTDPLRITPGSCGLNVALLVRGVIADHIKQAAMFDIEADDYYGTGKLTSRNKGICLLRQKWQIEMSYKPELSDQEEWKTL